MHDEISNEIETYVNNRISTNNQKFVLPKIEQEVEKNNRSSVQATPSIQDIARHSTDEDDIERVCNRFYVHEIEPKIVSMIEDHVHEACQEYLDHKISNVIDSNQSMLPKICESVIKEKVPGICNAIMKEELELACHSLIEKEVEPA